jgi:hypothetical protein
MLYNLNKNANDTNIQIHHKYIIYILNKNYIDISYKFIVRYVMLNSIYKS